MTVVINLDLNDVNSRLALPDELLHRLLSDLESAREFVGTVLQLEGVAKDVRNLVIRVLEQPVLDSDELVLTLACGLADVDEPLKLRTPTR